MSNLKRTVSNGRAFSAGAMRAARVSVTKSCAYGCGEKATMYDHINPLENGGTSDPTNCAYICTKCHSIKSKRERFIRELGNPFARDSNMALHVARYQNRVLTKDDKRKPGTRKVTIAKNQLTIQKIAYYERLIRRAQDENTKMHYRKLRAKWRRKLNGKKEW